MTEKEEKILALQLLLEDMRGSFPSSFGDVRMIKAKELAIELQFEAHVNRIAGIGDESDWDGRHFRTSVEDGGYVGMDDWHNLSKTFYDKSLEFRELMNATLEHPEYRFSDWKL